MIGSKTVTSARRLSANVLLSQKPNPAYTAFSTALVHASWRLPVLRRSYVGTRCFNMVPLTWSFSKNRRRSAVHRFTTCASVLVRNLHSSTCDTNLESDRVRSTGLVQASLPNRGFGFELRPGRLEPSAPSRWCRAGAHDAPSRQEFNLREYLVACRALGGTRWGAKLGDRAMASTVGSWLLQASAFVFIHEDAARDIRK